MKGYTIEINEIEPLDNRKWFEYRVIHDITQTISPYGKCVAETKNKLEEKLLAQLKRKLADPKIDPQPNVKLNYLERRRSFIIDAKNSKSEHVK